VILAPQISNIDITGVTGCPCRAVSSHVEPCRAMSSHVEPWGFLLPGASGRALRDGMVRFSGSQCCLGVAPQKWTWNGHAEAKTWATYSGRRGSGIFDTLKMVKMVEMAVYTPKINVSIWLNMVKYWTGSQQVPLGHFFCCAAQESLQRVQQVAGDLLKKQKVKSWAWMPWLRRKHCRLLNIDNLENIYIHTHTHTA